MRSVTVVFPPPKSEFGQEGFYKIRKSKLVDLFFFFLSISFIKIKHLRISFRTTEKNVGKTSIWPILLPSPIYGSIEKSMWLSIFHYFLMRRMREMDCKKQRRTKCDRVRERIASQSINDSSCCSLALHIKSSLNDASVESIHIFFLVCLSHCPYVSAHCISAMHTHMRIQWKWKLMYESQMSVAWLAHNLMY